MEEAHILLKLADLLGIHTAVPLAAMAIAALLYRRNLELQRKLFKLAHAQVLALAKMEATLETTVEALKAANRDRFRTYGQPQPQPYNPDRDPDAH